MEVKPLELGSEIYQFCHLLPAELNNEWEEGHSHTFPALQHHKLELDVQKRRNSWFYKEQSHSS